MDWYVGYGLCTALGGSRVKIIRSVDGVCPRELRRVPSTMPRHLLSRQSRSRTKSSLQSRDKVVRKLSSEPKPRDGRCGTDPSVRTGVFCSVVSGPLCSPRQGCYILWEGSNVLRVTAVSIAPFIHHGRINIDIAWIPRRLTEMIGRAAD